MDSEKIKVQDEESIDTLLLENNLKRMKIPNVKEFIIQNEDSLFKAISKSIFYDVKHFNEVKKACLLKLQELMHNKENVFLFLLRHIIYQRDFVIFL